MKRLITLFSFVLAVGICQQVRGQLGVTINIGSQPVWGPAGYDYAEYYFFPDIDVYYHVPTREFIYFDRGRWLSAYSLPPYYNNYDLFRSYKVVINEARPFARNDYWHSRYYAYRGRPQEIIYNSRDPKYYVINEHPQHSRWLNSRANNDRGFAIGLQRYRRNDVAGNDPLRNNIGRYDRQMIDPDKDDRWRSDNYPKANDNRRWNQDNRRWNQNNGRGNDNVKDYGWRRN